MGTSRVSRTSWPMSTCRGDASRPMGYVREVLLADPGETAPWSSSPSSIGCSAPWPTPPRPSPTSTAGGLNSWIDVAQRDELLQHQGLVLGRSEFLQLFGFDDNTAVAAVG